MARRKSITKQCADLREDLISIIIGQSRVKFNTEITYDYARAYLEECTCVFDTENTPAYIRVNTKAGYIDITFKTTIAKAIHLQETDPIKFTRAIRGNKRHI